MSQAKVEQYKKEKANRKQTIARQKAISRLVKAVVAIVVVAIIVAVGTAGYKAYERNQPAETYYVDLTGVQEYLATLGD